MLQASLLLWLLNLGKPFALPHLSGGLLLAADATLILLAPALLAWRVRSTVVPAPSLRHRGMPESTATWYVLAIAALLLAHLIGRVCGFVTAALLHQPGHPFYLTLFTGFGPGIGWYLALSAAIGEELFDRYALANVLKTDFASPSQTTRYIWVSTLMFTAPHWHSGIGNMVSACMFGATAAKLYSLRRCLPPLILAHLFVDLYYFT